MKNDSIQEKIEKTMSFYDKYPMATGEFREGKSALKMEDIQISLDELKGKRILDCGCGPGNISLYILEKVKNADIFSMDISLDSLEILKNRIKKISPMSEFIPIRADVLDIPFKKNIFDFIIVAGVIHHTPKPYEAFVNLIKRLKKGEKMYLSVYNKKSIYYMEFNTLGKIFRFFYKYNAKRFLSVSIYLFRTILSMINGKKIPRNDAEKIFADRYLTPVASFHDYKQIKEWCVKNNAAILKNGNCKLGTLIWFIIKKDGE